MTAQLRHEVSFVLCRTNPKHTSDRNHLLEDFARRVSSNKETALGVFRDVVQRLYRDILYFQS